MDFIKLHPGFKLPTKGTEFAGARDLYMPTDGDAQEYGGTLYGLGFAAAVPTGFVALILPRSGAGSKYGLELTNTCGVIDADYRGEWKAMLQVKNFPAFKWSAGDRLLQYLLVPVLDSEPVLVQELKPTSRGTGGFGSTG